MAYLDLHVHTNELLLGPEKILGDGLLWPRKTSSDLCTDTVESPESLS